MMDREPTKQQYEAIATFANTVKALGTAKVMIAITETSNDGTAGKIEFLDKTTGDHLGELAYMRLPFLGNQEIFELATVGDFNGLDVTNITE